MTETSSRLSVIKRVMCFYYVIMEIKNHKQMKSYPHLVLLAGLLLFSFSQSDAQFRSGTDSALDRTGPIVRASDQDRNWLFGLQDFRMDHSYEMTMGSFGGNMYNQNIYTNTMHMMFRENLYGRVDLAMSHSPFGSGFMGQDQTQFFIRNAELNYKLSENTRFQIRFQQIPGGHGYRPGYYSPHFNRNHMHHPFSAWY